MVALRGRVEERRADRETGLRDIRSPNVVQGKSMSGRLDAGDVNFGQLLDVSKDAAELGRKAGLFLGRERESR